MSYQYKNFMNCKKILEESSLYNITHHELAKMIKDDVYAETKAFPSTISYSKRIRAIAAQTQCICKHCGTIHGEPTRDYCSNACYQELKKANAPSKEQAAINKAIDLGNKKFTDKVEGIDYLICAICGAKSGDLGSHVKMHGITPADYKIKYSIQALKPQTNRDNRKGDKNPAFGHNGKYSAWSKNFIHGYDKDRHDVKSQQQVELRASSPEKFKTDIAYWLVQCNGDLEEATTAYKKFQIRDLTYFIDKYGQEEGTARHTAKTEKWITTMNVKPLEELTRINAAKVKKSGCFFSKAERELFDHLQVTVPELTDQFPLCRNTEASKKLFYLYDMQYKNKIIEYNGDFWHANPALYDFTFSNPYSKKTQAEINAKDTDKIALATEAGYYVHIVWEHEYKKDKNKVIQECLNFLTH